MTTKVVFIRFGASEKIESFFTLKYTIPEAKYLENQANAKRGVFRVIPAVVKIKFMLIVETYSGSHSNTPHIKERKPDVAFLR
jgi:hypothetical protein